MTRSLGTRPPLCIAAAALSIGLIAACSASAASLPSRSAAVAAPTAASTAAATPAPAGSAPAVSEPASPSATSAPTHDHTAQPSPAPVAPASGAAATASAATATAAAPASAAASQTPAAVAAAVTQAPTPAAAAQAPAGPIAVTLLDSAIKLDRSSAAAGSVTFTIRNAGTVMHQLVVLKTDVPQDKIPSDPTQPAKVTRPGFITETKDMDPGTSLTLTLPLAAGKYVLMCNLLAHYLVGMHTGFTTN